MTIKQHSEAITAWYISCYGRNEGLALAMKTWNNIMIEIEDIINEGNIDYALRLSIEADERKAAIDRELEREQA